MNAVTDTVEPIKPIGYQSKATTPALAKMIALWFPELSGRALPVSEAKITRDNVPTLPLCMVSLVREMGHCYPKTGRCEPEEEIAVEFWFKPERYKTDQNGETPFWAFYDYDTLRDVFITHLRTWTTPRGSRMEYYSLDVDSDQFATVITFVLRHTFAFCDFEPFHDPCVPSTELDGQPIRPGQILFTLCQPIGTVCIEPEPKI